MPGIIEQMLTNLSLGQEIRFISNIDSWAFTKDLNLSHGNPNVFLSKCKMLLNMESKNYCLYLTTLSTERTKMDQEQINVLKLALCNT